MSKLRRRFELQVESLEGKVVPSSLMPTLTHRTFNNVLHQIDRAAGTYSRTQNPRQFDGQLTQIASRVPFGRSQLLPIWQDDATIYTGVRDGSGMEMVRQIKSDFVAYVRAGVNAGAFRFR